MSLPRWHGDGRRQQDSAVAFRFSLLTDVYCGLRHYAFANFSLCSLRPEAPLPELPVEMGKQGSVPLRCEGEAWALAPKGSAAAEYALSLPELLSAPVREGQQVGTLTVRLGGETVAEIPILAAGEVPRIGFWGIFKKLAGSLIGL